MATALPSSCEEQESNNLDEYSDDSEAGSEKVRKAKKSKIPANVKWSDSLICNLINEYEARPSCITVTIIVATAALLS